MAAAAAPAKPSWPALKGQTAVILGATGYVGSGVAWKYLEAGANVVAVGREQKKLDVLKTQLGKLVTKDNFFTVVGGFDDEKTARATLAAVQAVAKTYHHVMSNIGFVDILKTGITETPLAQVKKSAYEDAFFPTVIAAQVFLPPLKDVVGSSYSISSGGLAHFCMQPNFFAATLKNSATNALGLCLAKEYEKTKVNVTVCCIHFGVAPFDGSKNQFGMDGADTRRLGPLFLTLATSAKARGLVTCANTAEEAEKLALSLQ